MRRLIARFAFELLGTRGAESAMPSPTISRSGKCFWNTFTMLSARLLESSQLDGNCKVLIGISSVCPVICINPGVFLSVAMMFAIGISFWRVICAEDGLN